MHRIINLLDLKDNICLRKHLKKHICENTILPSLERARIYNSNLAQNTSFSFQSDYFNQTTTILFYICIAMVAYVVFIIWLVYSNLQPSYRVSSFFHGEEEGISEETLLIVRDNGSGNIPSSSLFLYDEEKEDTSIL
nr:uncharacterized protein LOC121128447 [Lepeophtheirus salmonis]